MRSDYEKFPKEVAADLATSHADKIRGPKGVDGKNEEEGKTGINAVAPPLEDVTKTLFATYGEKLRGKDGENGKSQTSNLSSMIYSTATATSCAGRGPKGDDGKNGQDGKNDTDGKPGAVLSLDPGGRRQIAV